MKSISVINSFSPRLKSTIVVATLVTLTGCGGNRTQPQVIDTSAPPPAPSQQNVEMIRALSELTALKEDLKQMRNSVEQMQFQQENATRRQEDLFQDIDRRLLSLEDRVENVSQVSGSPVTDPNAPVFVDPNSGQLLVEGQTGTGISAANQVGQVSGQAAGSGSQVDTVTVVDAAPSLSSADTNQAASQTSANTTGATSVSLSEQQAYEAAFDLLKQSRYEDAIKQFDALVNTWPNGELADDSLYWKSEANYVNREFEAALQGFRSIVERYPDSSRLPEAMLKVGYIQYDIGAYDQAAATFQDILTRFPGHQVTVSADTRLRRIQQTIQ